MTLLPKTYTSFCPKCNMPFESVNKSMLTFGAVLCPECSDEQKGYLAEMIKNWALNPNNQSVEFVPVHPQLTSKSEVLYLELRGDDLEMIKYIKQHCTIEDKKAYSWLCYLENEIKQKLKG